jgi:preprotein translocase subunit SecE
VGGIVRGEGEGVGSRVGKARGVSRERFEGVARRPGGVAEWSIATVLKTVVRETAPGVRIPPPPPKKAQKGTMKEYLPIILGIVIAMVVFTIFWRKGSFLRISGYWSETVEELKKCTWPTWDELLGSTVVVIVAVALLGGFTIGIDLLIAYFVRLIV